MPKKMIRVELAKVGTIYPHGVDGAFDLTAEILQSVADTHAELSNFVVPLTFGHRPADGDPARGRIENLSFEDDTLFGDLLAVPEGVAAMMASGEYHGRSIGLMKDAVIGGKVRKWALGHVALLGAEQPAVQGMTPLFDVEQIAAAVNSGVRESDLLSRYVHQAGNSPSYVVQWSTTTPPTVQASDPGSPNPIPSEDQGMTAEEMLRSLLGLGEDATPEEMAEAFEAFNAAADPEEEEEVAQLKAKIKTLEAAAAQPTDDSAKALAAQNAKLIGEMEELRTEVATMRSDSEEKEVNASLDAAIASGRLSKDGVKHMKELYTAGGKKVVDLALAALPVGLPQGELGTSGTGNETTENTTVDFEKYRDRVDAGLDEKGARIRMVACAHAAGEFDEDDIRTSAPGFIAAAAKKEG